MPSLVISSLLLIATNMLPLFGVLYWGWDLFSILVLYWIESGVVGAINILKIRRAQAPVTGPISMTVNGRSVDPTPSALAGFFVLHYGIFWVVHGVFVAVLPLFAATASLGEAFGEAPASGPQLGYGGFDPVHIVLGTIGLTASHLLSYWFNYIGGQEYRFTDPATQTMRPYGRVVFMHIIVIVGAWFVIGRDATPLVAFMVLLKTTIDLALHIWEHRRAQRPVTGPPSLRAELGIPFRRS